MDITTKRICVTGGSGFLGKALVRELQSRGCPSPFVPRSSMYDLRDPLAIEALWNDAKPDIVIHAAARVGGIGANRKQPGTFFYDNAIMGIQLVEAARRHHLPKLVLIGTTCSYPKFAAIPFVEEDFWNGYPEETNAPYGIAKKALLVQAQAYRQQFGLNSIYLVPVNLYGPEDNFDPDSSHVIPALIKKCVEAVQTNASEIRCWGDGSPSREFLYVDDCAHAIVDATERYEGSEPVNIGAGREIRIAELIALIAKITGFRGKIAWDTNYPNGQPRRAMDTTRATKEFGFRATCSLEEGLERTIAWYMNSIVSTAAR